MLTVRDLLNEHFVKWQYESGVNKKQAEFATYVGESQKYLSMIMNGRKPSKRQVQLFAEFFKDPRFYDAYGMERPEPLTQFILRTLPLAPENIQKEIAEKLTPYTTELMPNGENEQTHHFNQQ
jgi:transcriptional regulator with XRE-family HTH domain